MDILPSGNIFRELQVVHDTGYLSAQTSLEDHWEQVSLQPTFSSVAYETPAPSTGQVWQLRALEIDSRCVQWARIYLPGKENAPASVKANRSDSPSNVNESPLRPPRTRLSEFG